LISVTRQCPPVIGNAPFGLPDRRGGSCSQAFVVWPMTRVTAGTGSVMITIRQFLMPTETMAPAGVSIASPGLNRWSGPAPGTPGTPYQ
jgi:hypothetical protein